MEPDLVQADHWSALTPHTATLCHMTWGFKAVRAHLTLILLWFLASISQSLL